MLFILVLIRSFNCWGGVLGMEWMCSVSVHGSLKRLWIVFVIGIW